MRIIPKLVVAAVGLMAMGALGATTVVNQKDKQFSTSEINIKVGDTVAFKNEDETAHNVFSTTAGSTFNLKIQKPGQESNQVFSAPGAVDVRCAIHPKMTLKINVTP